MRSPRIRTGRDPNSCSDLPERASELAELILENVKALDRRGRDPQRPLRTFALKAQIQTSRQRVERDAQPAQQDERPDANERNSWIVPILDPAVQAIALRGQRIAVP